MRQNDVAKEVFNSIETLIEQSGTDINGVLAYPSLAGRNCIFSIWFKRLEIEESTDNDFTFEWKNMLANKFSNESSAVDGVSWGKAFIEVPLGFKITPRLDISTASPNLTEIENQIAMACEITVTPEEPEVVE